MAATAQGRDVAQFIRDQHEEIERLLLQVSTSNGDDRRDAFRKVARQLAVHETAEAEAIYTVVRSQLGGDEVADARVQEESETKRMLSDLEQVDVESDEFPPRSTVLRGAVLRHATSEEATVLPLLEATRDRDTLDRMGQATLAAEKLAPTHPHGPGSAVDNLDVGPLAASADRTRALRNLTR